MASQLYIHTSHVVSFRDWKCKGYTFSTLTRFIPILLDTNMLPLELSNAATITHQEVSYNIIH